MPRGQAAVEFILVLPLFLFLLIAIIEFAFVFSTLNALSFAVRDIAQVGVEGGNRTGTDCSMLNDLEGALGASSSPSGISKVEIFWSDQNGNILNSAINVYLRTGSTTCTKLDGVTLTLPYTLQSGASYLETARCSVLAGCTGVSPSHPSVDTLGVRITYSYSWKTPLSAMLQMAPTLTFHADQQMRVEPVL